MEDPSTSSPRPESGADKAPPRREYTREQEEIIERVHKAGGDYYLCLGLDKTATETDLKSAYRKLALKLHPDKNGAPGADEAFKSVHKAFTILTDTEQRDMFDRFGSEANPKVRPSPFSHAGFRSHGPMHDDLFQAFFDGGVPYTFTRSGMRRSANPRRRRRDPDLERTRRKQQMAKEPNWSLAFLQVLPVLLLAALAFVLYKPQLFTDSTPEFRFAPTGTYTHHRFTPHNGVSYYVDKSQFKHLGLRQGPMAGLRGFEDQVEKAYADDLRTECKTFQRAHDRRFWSAMGFGDSPADSRRVSRIRRERNEACERLKDFQ